MAQIDGAKQGTIVLDGVVQICARQIDLGQILGFHETEDVADELGGQMRECEHHGGGDGDGDGEGDDDYNKADEDEHENKETYSHMMGRNRKKSRNTIGLGQ